MKKSKHSSDKSERSKGKAKNTPNAEAKPAAGGEPVNKNEELPKKTTKKEKRLDSLQHNKIVITGPFGSGKSAVAKKLASMIGWGHVDVHDMIEEKYGDVNKLGTKQENHFFRFNRLESEIVSEIAKKSQVVVSTGDKTLKHNGNVSILGIKKPYPFTGQEELDVRVFSILISPEEVWNRVAGREEYKPFFLRTLNEEKPAPCKAINSFAYSQKMHAAVYNSYEAIVSGRLGSDGIAQKIYELIA